MLNNLKKNIPTLLQKGNIAQAEILLRIWLQKEPNNPIALYFLGRIATAVALPQFALHYFSEAAKWMHDWKIPQVDQDRISKLLSECQRQSFTDRPGLKQTNSTEKYLLVKAWGYGFWADVSHVLGQLLVAELTGRTPIVHWGANSLFGDGNDSNAFEFYYEALSDRNMADIQSDEFDFWPPKWNSQNLNGDEINKWNGPFSRIPGFLFLSRQERVVVSDFSTPIFDLKPWIPKNHHLYGLSVDELWQYLMNKYLHPKKEILDLVDIFYEKRLAASDFMAVHARGSDKVLEVDNLDEVNKQYKGIIDQCLSSFNFKQIFLMTDDTRILDYFKQTFGDMVITTDCHRTSSEKGIHYHDLPDSRQLGIEVMVDVYLATRAKVFVGNGASNPSLMVRYLKDWPEDAMNLIGKNIKNSPNLFLHDW